MNGANSRIQNTGLRSCLIKASSWFISLGIVIFFRKSRNTTDYHLSELLRFARPRRGSVILKLVHPLAKRIGARWVWSRGRRYLVYMKLDPMKVAWIIRQKQARVPSIEIAHAMSVSERRVQRLWSAYRATGEIPSLKRPGRKHV